MFHIKQQMRPRIGLPALICIALLLSQCIAPITVHKTKPVPPRAGLAVDAPTIDRVHVAYQRLANGDESALSAYNHWVGRLIEELEADKLNPWSQPITLPSTSRTRSLRGRSVNGSDPAAHQLIPTDTLVFRGEFSELRPGVAGVGAPLVEVTSYAGIGREEIRSLLPVRNLTAIVHFKGRDATIELVDPYQTEDITLAGRHYHLAGDPGAALMLALSKARIDRLGLARLLRPSRYNDTAQLNFVQPYDAERIPVLFVHGLQDTPATWAPAYFHLINDPVIRRHYQFWSFSYPSGYPYPYSASLLRRELDEVKRQFPDRKNLVIIGHSMGSLISRLMVTDAGDKLWVRAFGSTPAETRIVGNSRKIVEDSLVFERRPEIDRAIFISAPHRGSQLASNWVGRISSRLVRMPAFMADMRNLMVSMASVDVVGLMIQRAPNSIDTLSPDNLFVQEINKIPITAGIPFHSIIGDRGRGDTPDSSDGVVAYWSSHLDGSASEKIVPSGHSANQHPEGIREIHRILLKHLEAH